MEGNQGGPGGVENELRRMGGRLIFVISLCLALLGLVLLYQTHNPSGDVTCPQLFFDVSTMHNDLEISGNGDVIANTNRYVKIRLENYHGILGIFSVGNIGEFQIKISVTIDIQKKIKGDNPLFEIAFAERKQLKNDAFDRKIKTSLSILGKKCSSKHMCLIVQRRGVTYKKMEITGINVGSYIGVVTMTKENDSIVIHVSDKEPICKPLLKLPQDNIFNNDIVPVYGVTKNDSTARVLLTVIRDVDNVASFDETTCHKTIYTSGDGKAIANYNVGIQFRRGGAFSKAYRGVLGDIAFKENNNDNESFLLKPDYFEIKVHFDVDLRNTEVESSLFEFGLSPRNLIDNHRVLRYHSSAIIVSIGRCTKRLRLCMSYWQDGTQDRMYTAFGQYYEKVNDSFTFGLKVDSSEHIVSVYLVNERKEWVHDFLDVSFVRPLYPVFGLTDRSFVKIHLLSSSSVTRMYTVLGFFPQYPACEI